MAEQKSFPASRRKLEKARKDGDVAKSAEVSASFGWILGFLATLLVARSRGPQLLLLGQKMFASGADTNPMNMVCFVRIVAREFCFLVSFPLVAAFVGVLAMEIFQTGMQVNFALLLPKANRLDIAKGFQRLIGLDVECGIALKIVGLLRISLHLVLSITIMTGIVWKFGGLMLHARPADGAQLAELCWWTAVSLIALGVPTFLFGMLDFSLQRWQRGKRLRMDVNELKREHRETEGEPIMKSYRKQLFQKLVFHGIVQGVRKARLLVMGRTEERQH